MHAYLNGENAGNFERNTGRIVDIIHIALVCVIDTSARNGLSDGKRFADGICGDHLRRGTVGSRFA